MKRIEKRKMIDQVEVLQGCKRGKERYFQLLYKQYAPKVMGICRRYCKDESEAKDVFQDSFIKIFERIHQLKDAKAMGGWIRRVAVNTAINHFNKHKKYSFLDFDDVSPIQVCSESALSRLNHEAMLQLINDLPTGYRMVFNLYVIEGYSHKEIAEKFQVTESTSKSQLSKAKRMLRRRIEELNEVKYGQSGRKIS